MDFRTTIERTNSPFQIDVKDAICCYGSCFASTMGERLSQNKFRVDTNSAGILFNPMSIFELFELALNEDIMSANTYLTTDEIVYNYKFHSSVTSENVLDLEANIEKKLQVLKETLSNANYLILTFGTAWVYQHKEHDFLVANCHKQPSQNFTKRLLSNSEIETGFSSLQSLLKKVNPEIKIILTVSPIRHTKEGLSNNGISKAILRSACHSIEEANLNVQYFPAFEILMDDLRDYRFYETDLIHPSDFAQDYVWEVFSKGYFNSNTLEFVKAWEQIQKDLNHKAFHSKSKAHQQFLKTTMKKLNAFKDLVVITEELKQLEAQIN